VDDVTFSMTTSWRLAHSAAAAATCALVVVAYCLSRCARAHARRASWRGQRGHGRSEHNCLSFAHLRSACRPVAATKVGHPQDFCRPVAATKVGHLQLAADLWLRPKWDIRNLLPTCGTGCFWDMW